MKRIWLPLLFIPLLLVVLSIPAGGAAPPMRACSDSIDNDNDGLIDFPADPGCANKNDRDEFNASPPPAPQCSNGINDDPTEDSLIDYPADPGCTSGSDISESPNPPPPNTCSKYAAPNGSDSNSGTISAPYLTPKFLFEHLAPGLTGCFRAGTYGSPSTQHWLTDTYGNHSGTPTQRITLTSYPGEVALIKGHLIEDSSYITFRNLVFDGYNTFGGSFYCGEGNTNALALYGNGIIFEHNEVYQSGPAGTGASAIFTVGNDLILRYNKIHDFGGCYHFDHGVYLGDGNNAQIHHNWIWNNSNGWGVQLYAHPNDARVHHNVIDANGAGVVICEGGPGTTNTGNQFYNNVVANSVGTTYSGGTGPAALLSGCGVNAGSNNTVTNNCSFNNRDGIGSAPNVIMSGNFLCDPLFVNAGTHNYAVQSGSPVATWGLWDGVS